MSSENFDNKTMMNDSISEIGTPSMIHMFSRDNGMMQLDNCDLTRELDEIVMRKDSNYSGKKSRDFMRAGKSREKMRLDSYNLERQEAATKPKKKKTRRKKKDKGKLKKMKKLKNMEKNNSYDTRGPQT